MVAAECAPAHRRATIVSAVFLHFLVFVSLARLGTAQQQTIGPINTTSTFLPPTQQPVTHLPPTKHTAHTVAPPPPPTIGLLCGDYQTDSYDLRNLTSAMYWRFKQNGQCVDSYGSTYNCEFSFAFCKPLPQDLTRSVPGIGAVQLSDKPGSQAVLLGGLSQIKQNSDEQGYQLVIKFAKGDQCVDNPDKNYEVELHLHCDRNAYWLTPITGQGGTMPTGTFAAYDQSTCLYTVESYYAGACAVLVYQGLSAGTIIIIVFFGFVAVYLIGGVIFNKMAGAKGLELIPNYDMWRMFPSDVMGGLGFVWGIITCRGTVAKQQVYDEL